MCQNENNCKSEKSKMAAMVFKSNLIISHCAAKYSYLHISVASKPRHVNHISSIDMSVEKRL